jgi:hypothetical protein
MNPTTLALRIGAAILAFVLSGCSGGGGDGGVQFVPICEVIGNGSNVSAAGIDEPVLGFDGHLDSYATLGPADSATGTLSGGGVPRPAGEFAGVAFTTPTAGVVSVTITLYAGNVPIKSREAATLDYSSTNSVCPEYCTHSDRTGHSFVGIPATGQYDRIEAVLSISDLDQPLQIRELCVR